MHGFSEIGIKFDGFSVWDTAGNDFAIALTGDALAGIGLLSDLTRGVAQIAHISGRDGELSEMS